MKCNHVVGTKVIVADYRILCKLIRKDHAIEGVDYYFSYCPNCGQKLLEQEEKIKDQENED